MVQREFNIAGNDDKSRSQGMQLQSSVIEEDIIYQDAKQHQEIEMVEMYHGILTEDQDQTAKFEHSIEQQAPIEEIEDSQSADMIME